MGTCSTTDWVAAFLMGAGFAVIAVLAGAILADSWWHRRTPHSAPRTEDPYVLPNVRLTGAADEIRALRQFSEAQDHELRALKDELRVSNEVIGCLRDELTMARLADLRFVPPMLPSTALYVMS